jgi:hypothetical protein
MPSTLAELYPAYGIQSQPIGLGGLGTQYAGLGGLGSASTFAGLPMNSLAMLAAQRGGGLPAPTGYGSLSSLTAPPPSTTTTAPVGSSDLDRAMQSISSIESGGRYDRLGPVTGSGDRAYGRYQVMGANIGPWTLRYLGRSMTPQEFIADPAAQDAIFRGQFGSYLTRYGNPSDAASMWFTGRPYSQGYGRSDAIPGVHPGLTGAQYVSRFLAGL